MIINVNEALRILKIVQGNEKKIYCHRDVYKKAVNSLITDYERLEKENKELKTVLDKLSKTNLNAYIPKQKIKDKIKELEDLKLYGGAVHQAISEEKILMLKELIEENEEME